MSDTIPQDDIPRKQCTGPCKRLLPATSEYFHTRSDRKSGLRSECVDCGRTRARNFARKHSEQHRQNSHRNYWRNPELSRAKNREQHRKHHEKRIEGKRRYREAHRTEILAYAEWYAVTHPDQRRGWRERNRHKLRAYSQKYRALECRADGEITEQDIEQQDKRQKGKCYYCRAKLTKYHVEHIVPLSRGGTNDPSNIVLACPSCNHQKCARLPHEWPEGGRLL